MWGAGNHIYFRMGRGEDGDMERDCSPFSDHEYLSSISICIFSSFRFREQSCPLTQENKRQATCCDISHAHANAQAGCLAELGGRGAERETVQASGFLRIKSTALYLSPCGRDIWHAGNRGFAVPKGQCEQKELRSAVF